MFAIATVNHRLDHTFERGTEMGFWTLEYLEAGQVQVETPHGASVSVAPSVLLIPANTPYGLKWAGGAGPWTEIYSIFEPPPHWSSLLVWPVREHGLGVLDLPDSATTREVEAALTAALEAGRSARANKRQFAFNALEKALICLDEINPLRGNVQREARIERALSFIATHYRQPLSLEGLARQVYVSPSRLSHLFKEQMGVSPMQYLEGYRLDRAAEKLLAEQDSIEQVAHAVGFRNAFHFSTRFRLRFGRSPSRYRVNPK